MISDIYVMHSTARLKKRHCYLLCSLFSKSPSNSLHCQRTDHQVNSRTPESCSCGRRHCTRRKYSLSTRQRCVQKKWTDIKSGKYSFMLYPRSLFVTWGHRIENWSWNCFKEISDDNIEVVKLRAVCWLDVRGKLAMAELSPGVTYEGVYVIKLTKSASGWELPVMLRLTIPGQQTKIRQVSLFDKPRGEWFELKLGTFQAEANVDGELSFDIFERGGHWKSGLIIRGVIIRPTL